MGAAFSTTAVDVVKVAEAKRSLLRRRAIVR